MSVTIFCKNKYKSRCLKCGKELNAGDGNYGEFIASYKQKNLHYRSHDFHRLDYQKGVYCNECIDYLKGE